MDYFHLARATSPELLDVLENLPMRPVPKWLGDFSFRIYGQAYGKNYGKPPALIQDEINFLKGFAMGQTWTTYFVQRYEAGQGVKAHRDPKNNIGYTVIGLYGEFSGTLLRVGSDWQAQKSGDVAVLPCTISGVQGPEHEMIWSSNPVGRRYAIILNTIT